VLQQIRKNPGLQADEAAPPERSQLSQPTPSLPAACGQSPKTPTKYSQPCLHSARRKPVTQCGQRPMRLQLNPMQWISIINATRP
jgi:hypothetical protein